jgi:hypothetical protein
MLAYRTPARHRHQAPACFGVGAQAWLQGKLFVATLIETLIAIGERFSPWDYFLPTEPEATQPLA